jgi:hypothetical protein
MMETYEQIDFKRKKEERMIEICYAGHERSKSTAT